MAEKTKGDVELLKQINTLTLDHSKVNLPECFDFLEPEKQALKERLDRAVKGHAKWSESIQAVWNDDTLGLYARVWLVHELGTRRGMGLIGQGQP